MSIMTPAAQAGPPPRLICNPCLAADAAQTGPQPQTRDPQPQPQPCGPWDCPFRPSEWFRNPLLEPLLLPYNWGSATAAAHEPLLLEECTGSSA